MALSVDEHPCLSFQMTPEAPDQSDASSSSTVSSSDSDSGCALEYYLDVKPYSSSNGYMLPSSDTEELKFVRTLLHLLPPQDCDDRFCTALGEFEKRELQEFSAHRRVHSMKHRAIVHVTDDSSESCCMRCSGKILAGDTAVCTERFPDDNLRWHHKCFVCETCHLPLSQFIYFLQDSRIYCGRHHAELTRARCAACDQLIMSERCTIAEGLCWHVEHFCCWECEMVLGGSRYFLKGGRPFCSGCFQRFHAESCEACGEPVDPEGELVTFKGQYWHTLPSCFCCSSCRTPLQKSEFMAHDDNFYCSQHCLTLGSRLSFSSKYHINMIEPSSAKCNSYLHFSCHVTPGTPNSKQIKPLPHETCSATRCQEVIQRLFIDRDKESNKSWLPKHNQIIEVEEDSSCSSSDSEPEGFFLGRPIPSYSLNRESNSSVRGKSMDIKSRHRGKSCKVS